MRLFSLAVMALISMSLQIGAASAQTEGYHDLPTDKSLGLREAATPIAEEIAIFHDFVLLPIMVVISVFVLLLLIWVAIRYNSKANPVPSKFSHNTTVEVVWTLVPVLILLLIAVPSFELLYVQDKMPDGQTHNYEAGESRVAFPNDFAERRRIAKDSHLEVMVVDTATGEERLLTIDDYDVEGFGQENLIIALNQEIGTDSHLRVVGGRSRVGQRPILGVFGEDKSRIIPAPTVTIKTVGWQWGWTYTYPEYGNIEFDALIAPKETVPSELFRFATTNDVVVPAGETVRLVVTGRDVLHSWAMPAFGTKIDAVPGRLNETWFYTEKEGTYYGQCSEICGIDHAFMPISVRVVSRPEFEAWINEQADLNGLEPFFDADIDQLAAADLPAELN